MTVKKQTLHKRGPIDRAFVTHSDVQACLNSTLGHCFGKNGELNRWGYLYLAGCVVFNLYLYKWVVEFLFKKVGA
jgi:hypothetical protein